MHRRAFHQLGAVVAAFLAPAARAQCAEWSERFIANGTNGTVEMLGVFDDGAGPVLFVGGPFNSAGGVSASNVARWDGDAWSLAGSGFGGTIPCCDPREALCSVVFDDGTGPALYVGGRFLAAGATTVNNVAKWDGSSWSALGQGVDGGVHALVEFDDGTGPALYASGGFLNAGGVSAPGIARWDGTSWSALGAGTTTDLGIKVRALAVFDSGSGPALYAGGHIYNYNGTNLGHIGRWNGTNWSTVGGGVNQVVTTLLVHDDGSAPALYAGGKFTQAGGAPASHIAKWNGTSWSALGSGTGAAVDALVTFDDGNGPALFAGGVFGIAGGITTRGVARWDGASWSAVGGGVLGNVTALGVFDDGSGAALYVGGFLQGSGTLGANNLLRWDGAQWSELGGDAGLDWQVCALGTADVGNGPALYASGTFAVAGSLKVSGLARWDGSQWSDVDGGIGGYAKQFLQHDDGSGPALFVGGNFHGAGGNPAEYVAKWNGSTWSPLGSGTNGVVDALEVFDDGSGTALYVGGNFTTAGGAPTSYVACWDGASWSAVGAGPSSLVLALAAFDDGSGPALYAGGYYSGLSQTSIARWNGSTWSPVGGGLNQNVEALIVYDDGSGDALYAGGHFTMAGGAPAKGLAKWNGSTWSALAQELQAPWGPAVSALAVFDDGTGNGEELYVTGLFTGAGSVSAGRVAKWNGASWSALGTGVQSIVSGINVLPVAMAVFDDGSGGAPDLVIAGSFTHADGLPSSFIGAWRGCTPPLGTPYCFGDGSGTACPCGNASASGAEQGCAHSVGYGAHLGAQGSSSLASDDQTFIVSSMPANKSCVLFVGNAPMNGGAGVLFGDGLRCAGPSVHRLGVRTSDPSGVASWGPGFAPLNYWSPGDTRYFQVWFRDPSGPCGNATNMSSALALTFTN